MVMLGMFFRRRKSRQTDQLVTSRLARLAYPIRTESRYRAPTEKHSVAVRRVIVMQ